MALASLTVLLILVGYAALCALSPFGPCRKCAGTGLKKLTKPVKVCRRCRGDRYRLRVGRRLLNTSRAVHRDGTR